MANLNGKIALVTGGSRGLGQGIALVLGEHGCTVYITGRSTKENSQHPEWPNATIDKTAQLVTEMGGKGIPIQCDHTDDDQVDGVYERIKEEKGYIDILVNVIWGGYENMENFSKPFWDQPNWRIDKMYQTGVRTSYTACRIGAKLMLPRKQGLIINITFWDQDEYLEPVPQDFALTAMGRLLFAMAQELKPHNIASIALSPGFIRNEGMLSQEEIRGEYQRPPVVPKLYHQKLNLPNTQVELSSPLLATQILYREQVRFSMLETYLVNMDLQISTVHSHSLTRLDGQESLESVQKKHCFDYRPRFNFQ